MALMTDSQDSLKQQYGPDMDGPEHEASYRGFVHFTEIATFTVVLWVLCLAVGGIKHAWGWALVGVLLSFPAAAIGALASTIRWRAPAAVMALMVLVFLVK